MLRTGSVIEASLQDALKGEGDKFEALAGVELVLELHPAEKPRQKTQGYTGNQNQVQLD